MINLNNVSDFNLTEAAPKCKSNEIVNRYLFRTSHDYSRFFEDGGIRKSGRYKTSHVYMPLITIITVVYNSKDTLTETIESVLAQSYNNIEYIIIDGGSTDGSLEIIKKYSQSIDYYISEKDSGIYDAMNKGLSFATGEVIAFLNSGDWYEQDAVLFVVEKLLTLDRSKPLILYVDVLAIDEINKPTRVLDRNADRLLNGFTMCHQGCFVNQKSYNAIGGFDIRYKIAADHYFLTQHKLRGFYIGYVDYIGVNFDMNGISSANVLEGHHNILDFMSKLKLPFHKVLIDIFTCVQNNRYQYIQAKHLLLKYFDSVSASYQEMLKCPDMCFEHNGYIGVFNSQRDEFVKFMNSVFTD